jgi:hypothetical protein
VEDLMRGQWLGGYQGNTQGAVTVELDDLGDHYEGMAYVYPGTPGLPSIAGAVTTTDKSDKFSLQIKTDAIDMRNGSLVAWDSVKQNYPGVSLDPTIDTSWSCDRQNNVLVIDFNSKSGGSGKAHLSQSDGSRPPERTPLANVKSWDAFKEYALTLDPNRYVFRGQESSAWRLRTFFHRSGRASLFRFVNQDMHQLHAHLSSLTEHHFNLKDDLENAAFYSLVQNHGYERFRCRILGRDLGWGIRRSQRNALNDIAADNDCVRRSNRRVLTDISAPVSDQGGHQLVVRDRVVDGTMKVGNV